MCKKLIYLISVLVLALCLMPSVQAANITLVTEDHDDDADGIQDDQQLVDWLVAEGHVVNVKRDYWVAFARTTAAELNTADLIIISRSTSSGNYIDEDEPTKWNSLTVPLILMSAYPVRSSHWKWVDSASVLGEGGAPMLEAVDPGHSIFTNVPLDASNQVQIVDGAVGSGHTSFVDVADVGNGTLIAQTVDGLPWIAEWGPGVEFYAGAGQVAADKRMMFFAGTQEPPTYGAWNFTAEGEILFRNAISYMLGETIAPIVPPPPALVGHWKFDDGEGTVAVDSSGNGNDGILMGDPQWTEGKIGGALDFDGDGDYVDCGNDTIFDLTDAFSLTVWINWRTPTVDWQTVIAKGDNAWRLAKGADTQTMDFGFTDGGPRGWLAVRTASDVPLGEWHHVTATIDTIEGAKIYLDGVLDGTNPDIGGITVGDYPVFIGDNSQQTGRFWDGLIDDVRIYDGVLTEEEIQAVMMPTPEPVDPGVEGLVAHYAFENDANDSSGNELHGTLVGDPTFSEGPAGYGMALDLDGEGDYVDCGAPPQFDITEQIAITYWIKVVAFDKGWNTVLSRGDDSWRSSRAGENNFMEAAVSGTTGDWTYGVTPVDDGKWHHVGWVYDGTMNYLYVDGKVDATEESTGLITVSTYPLFIGNNSQNTDREWTGLIDEVMIYNRALSEPEVMYLAGKRATPVDPGTNGLVAYYALENNTDDSSGNELHGTIFGEPTYVEGPPGYGTAMAFDGVDDYVDFGNDPLFDITEQVTLALWVNTQDIGTLQDNPWLGKGDTSYMIKGYREGNQIEFFVYDSGWQVLHGDVGDSFNGVWHHAAGTYDGNQLKLYVDGELNVTSDYVGGIAPSTYNVAMGTNTEASGRFSESIMDEAVIYNRTLSAGEVRYLAGFRPMVDPGTDNLIAYYPLDIDTLDASGNGNDGTVNGDPNFVEGIVATAMEFDGDGDFLDCGNNPILALTDAVSISAWIKVAVQGADHKVGGNQDGANGGYKMSVYNDKIEFEIRTSGNSAVLNRSVEGGTILEVGVWYHVVGVYSLADGYIRTYVNGELDRELETTEALGASPGALMIGCEPFSTGQYNFNGVMDDIRVYNKALSEDEARYLANN